MLNYERILATKTLEGREAWSFGMDFCVCIQLLMARIFGHSVNSLPTVLQETSQSQPKTDQHLMVNFSTLVKSMTWWYCKFFIHEWVLCDKFIILKIFHFFTDTSHISSCCFCSARARAPGWYFKEFFPCWALTHQVTP